MNNKEEKPTLDQAISALIKDLGIRSSNKLWEIMGVAGNGKWYKKLRGELQTSKEDINQIIQALREAGYKVTAQHEKMLKEAIGIVVTIEEGDSSATPSQIIINLTQPSATIPDTAENSEAAEKRAERDYLEAVVRTYRHLQTGYTELSSAATFDQAEKRKQSWFFELLCQKYPPGSNVSDVFFASGADRPDITVVRGSIREQVAGLPAGAILGEPGAGKTTTLQRLALYYAQVALEQEPAAEGDCHAGKIPALVSLGGYRGEELLSYMQDYLGRARLDYPHSEILAARLKTYLEQGRLLVLFDALNEVADEYRSKASSDLMLFLNLYCSERAKQRNSCLLTCREANYHKDFSELPRLVLEPLADEQIENLVTNWFSQDSAAVGAIMVQLAVNGGLLRKQARNPMLLSVILRLYDSNRILPRSRGALFEAFAQYLIASGLQRGLDKSWLREFLPEQVTENLAVENLDETTRRRLAERLAGLITPALAWLGYAMLAEATQGTEPWLNWVFDILPDPVVTTFRYRQKLKSVEQRVERELGEVLSLAQKAGLLSLYRDSIDSEQDSLHFGHHLLQEYFAAVYLVSEKAGPADWNRAIRSYKFDQVFPFVTDLATDQTQPIKRLAELDLELACRCAGLLPAGQLDSSLQQNLIDRAVELLQSDFGPDQETAINALQYLKSSQTLIEFGLNHAESHVRSGVVGVLIRLKGKEAIPHLIPLLDDEDNLVRESVVVALIELEAKEAIPHLIPLLDDEDNLVRENVVEVLSRLAGREAIPHLIPLLKKYDSRSVRYSVIETLEKLEAKEAIPYLIPLLEVEDTGVRFMVVKTLDRLAGREAIPYLIPLLEVEDNWVRLGVAEALSGLGTKEAIPYLIPLLEVENSKIRERVIGALRYLEAKEVAISHLISRLKDEDSSVRERVIEALALLEAKEAIPHFIPLLKIDNNRVRESVIGALRYLEAKEAISYLIPLLEDEDSGIRSNVVWALAKLEAKEVAIPHLISSLLKDEDCEVRESVVNALSELKAKEAIPHLIPLLEDSYVCSMVIEALGELEAKEAIPHLIPLLDDEDSRVRFNVVEVLSKLEAKEAIPHLIPLLDDDDGWIRYTVVEVLSKLGDKSTVDLLTPMLSEKEDKEVREDVFNLRQGLKRKWGLPKDY